MWLALALGCHRDDPPPRGRPDPEPDHSATPAAAHSAAPPLPTAETAHTGAPAPLDCDARPAGPLPGVALRGNLHASEDFAFDGAGNLLSSDGRQILAQAYPPGDAVPIAPTGTDPSSMRMLLDGDLAVANIDTQALYRVRLSDGATSPIAVGFGYATGIDIHRDGHVFIGDGGRIKRIDPGSGAVEVAFDLADHGLRGIINGVSFGAAWDTLNFGTSDSLYRVPVDGDGRPTGPPELRGTFPPARGQLLGIGVDACDDVYALAGGTLFRVPSAGGPPEVLWTGGSTSTTNLQWGSGLGGWDAQAVYVVDRQVDHPPFVEIAVGVGEKPRD